MSSLPNLCIFVEQTPVAEAIATVLAGDRYHYSIFFSFDDFCRYIDQEKQAIDCLILQSSPQLTVTTKWLHGQAALFPAVMIVPAAAKGLREQSDSNFYYHTAEVWIAETEVQGLAEFIDRAITRFLNLSLSCRFAPTDAKEDRTNLTIQNFLPVQQRRLSEKLKERLGYLGVYYKRNPRNFYRHLPAEAKQEFIEALKNDYRKILLCYFAEEDDLNQRIDDLVNAAFFADISVSQIVEIHMELIDEFSKQLKLEGRSEEILLDYRLTLIDIIAHLCEMYRRSIPRES